MRKVDYLLFFTFVIAIMGCTSIPTTPLVTEKVVQITAPAGYTGPLIASWELGDPSLILKSDVSLAIPGIQLSGSDTKVFYSLIGMDTTRLINEKNIEIVDDNGRVFELIQVVPLYKIGELELGVMNFEARISGAMALYLQLRSAVDKTNSQNLLVVKFIGSSSEDRLNTIYSIKREGGVAQADYKLEMNLWLPPNELLLSDSSEPKPTTVSHLGATPTPVQASGVPWAEIPQDTYVKDEISFMVIDERNKQVVYLGVQLLSNGSAVTLQSGSVAVPTPIQVATPTPTPLPYP
jgi:hypothetical protein